VNPCDTLAARSLSAQDRKEYPNALSMYV